MDTPQAIEVNEPRRRGARSTWTAVAVVGLVVALLVGYSVLTGPTNAPQPGGAVPAFALTALDGTPMSLAGQQGQVRVVNFFASWCNPCRQEASDLEQTWREYRDRDVQFYGIAYKDAQSKAQAFLDEFDVTYPSALDPGNRTARAYGVTGVPETFVIDAQGQLVRHFLGPVSNGELSLALESALEP